MQVSNYILIAALEVYLLLTLLCVFLLFYVRNQRKLVNRQQQKLRELLNSQPKPAPPPLQQPITDSHTYREYISRQLDITRNQYQQIAGDNQITLEQSPEAPAMQKVLALRHHFLMAEESAVTFDGNKPLVRWDYLEQQLSSLLTRQTDTQGLETELANSKKRIENLEKFKQLFFDLERQWQEAQEKAQGYHQQLSDMVESVEDKAYFNDLLDRYHNTYNDVHQSMMTGRQALEKNPAVLYTNAHTHRPDSSIANEIIKLRNVAVDQHRIINQLQRKLEDAKTAEEKEVAIQDLQQQLQRQIRFVQEAETCVKLIEDELKNSQEKLHHHEQLLEKTQFAEEENQRMRELLHNFAFESKTLMTSIIELEQENDKLKRALSENASAQAVEALKSLQADHLILQTQYAELEEKYLQLRLKG
ncbi:hypothetical protein ACSV5M_13875 [Cellvibrio sp. ARAG 10.3]|uniref:hypothetical protein n=1 Tax=Cellvibrio sp. ARAG 10.3 TaxID=3451358 RepID=UPI003F44A69A